MGKFKEGLSGYQSFYGWVRIGLPGAWEGGGGGWVDGTSLGPVAPDTLVEGYSGGTGPGQGLFAWPSALPVSTAHGVYLSIPKTHSLIHRNFLQLILDSGALGCGPASP